MSDCKLRLSSTSDCHIAQILMRFLPLLESKYCQDHVGHYAISSWHVLETLSTPTTNSSVSRIFLFAVADPNFLDFSSEIPSYLTQIVHTYLITASFLPPSLFNNTGERVLAESRRQLLISSVFSKTPRR